MKTKKSKIIKTRLEYLRGELRAERISTDELLELQSLSQHIAPGDVELLEAAGVSEHAEAERKHTGGRSRPMNSHVYYHCTRCGRDNYFVNQCGCDKNNLPTRPIRVRPTRTPGNIERVVGRVGNGSPRSQGEQLVTDRGVGFMLIQHDGSPEGCANAEFIVRAVNSHDGMTVALEAIAAWLIAPATSQANIDYFRNMALAALAKAKGGA